MHGSMSGVGKRSQLATAPNLDSTEGDEGTPSREFFEAKQGKKEAEKGRKEPQGSIFWQEPTGMVFQG